MLRDMTRKLTTEDIAEIRASGKSVATLARDMGVARSTVYRALSRTRTADEFVGGGVAARPPPPKTGVYSWSLETIRAARDLQLSGSFEQPVRLAEAMRTNDALFVAYHNRVAPQNAISANLKTAGTARGDAIKKKAAAHIDVSRNVLSGILGTLVNHGVAVGYVRHTPNDSGTALRFTLEEWPLDFVKWNNSLEVLETSTHLGPRVSITHGDGHWVVFRKHVIKPWTQEACILPAALIFAAHGNGIRDWASASTSHGNAKLVGTLPEGARILKDSSGNLSTEADAFLTMLQDMVSGEAGAGIQAFGSKVDVVSNNSTAWQVFKELILDRAKAAARVYLGTDASLGSVGGAPGVDIATLFGVASTRVQGDLEALERGLYEGLYAPWTAIHYGDSRLAPSLAYDMPDPDEERIRAERENSYRRFAEIVGALREQRVIVDRETATRVAQAVGLDPVPRLAAPTEAAASFTLAPTDIARVVRIKEARESIGQPPFGDERDDLTISQLDEYTKANTDDPTGDSPDTGDTSERPGVPDEAEP